MDPEDKAVMIGRVSCLPYRPAIDNLQLVTKSADGRRVRWMETRPDWIRRQNPPLMRRTLLAGMVHSVLR